MSTRLYRAIRPYEFMLQRNFFVINIAICITLFNARLVFQEQRGFLMS